MARTIAEIQTAMIDSKESDSNLDGLTSTSVTAIWRLIFYVVAVAINAFESVLDVFYDDIEERADEIPVGTLYWYAYESKQFQYGYSLSLTDGILQYDTEDDDAKIVAYAAAIEVNGLVIIKVATTDDDGNATALTTAQLSAFDTYWENKRFAGTPIETRSLDPDVVKAYYTIDVDATVIDPSTGESLSDTDTYPVQDAINDYLQSFQEDDFDGILKVMGLTAAIKEVDGVNNVVATDIQAKAAADTEYTDILATEDQTYTSAAGYMAISSDFPLDDTLTYTY